MSSSLQTGNNDQRLAGFNQIAEPVRPLLDALSTFMDGQVAGFEPEIRHLVERCLRKQGKRIRPLLLFASSAAVDDDQTKDLITAAAVVELVHLATLLHDDILDGATLRHGDATLNTVHGDTVAVLLGDALFSQALKLAASFPTTDVCRLVAQSTRRVCTGEISQTFARGNIDLSIPEYFRMIELKTAELFAVACEIGAQISNQTPAQIEAARNFGRHLGTAYQIFDDAADFLGDEVKIGKTLGTDLDSGKYTLPLLLLWEQASEDQRSAWKDEVRNPHAAAESLNNLIGEHAIWPQVKAAFDKQMAAARTALSHIADLPSSSTLGAIADFLESHVDRLFESSEQMPR